MKVTLNFQNQTQEVHVKKDSNIATLVEANRESLSLPEKFIAKIDDIPINGEHKFSEGELIELRVSEVVYGANSIDIGECVGRKVGEVFKEYGQALNLPEGEKLRAEVNGKKVHLSYKIQPGDRVEPVKKKRTEVVKNEQ